MGTSEPRAGQRATLAPGRDNLTDKYEDENNFQIGPNSFDICVTDFCGRELYTKRVFRICIGRHG